MFIVNMQFCFISLTLIIILSGIRRVINIFDEHVAKIYEHM